MEVGVNVDNDGQHMFQRMTIGRQVSLRGTYSLGLQIDALCQTQEVRELTPTWQSSSVGSLLL